MLSHAIRRAYQVMRERNWDTVYWAIDLHGTVLSSTYENDQIAFITDAARVALKYISNLPESKIILWSSMGANQWPAVLEFFKEHGISIDYVNSNPEVENTETGDFSSKFYFSILIDDKAGFHPDEWNSVLHTTASCALERIRPPRY